jgi:hypothetical protein
VKIAALHSHQNGWEFIKVHKPALWAEIEKIIAAVDATTQEQSFKGEAQPRNRAPFAHRHEQVHGGRVW